MIVSSDIVLKSDAVRGFSSASSSSDLAHVWPVAAVARDDRPSRGRVGAQLAVAGRLCEQLRGLLGRQLVRREVVRHARALVAALEEWPVPPDAEDDAVRTRDLDRVDVPRVDRVEVVGDERVQPFFAVGAAVEAAEPVEAVLVALRDLVEVVLQPRGEVVVDETREMASRAAA